MSTDLKQPPSPAPAASTPSASAASTNTRERVLTCARDLFLEAGVSGFSMRKVARAAGLSATAIYRYFDSKEALLAAILEEGFGIFARYLWRSLSYSDPHARLVAQGRAYLDFALEHSHFYRMMFMIPNDELGIREFPVTLQRASQPTFQILADRVRECIEVGVIEAADPREIAAVIWSQCHGMVALYLAGKLDPDGAAASDFEVFFQRSFERLLRGLRPA